MLLALTRDPVRLPVVIPCVFLYRDGCIHTLRMLCALRGVALAARPAGKAKAVVHAAAAMGVVVLMVPYAWGMVGLATLRWGSVALLVVATGFTLYAAGEYCWAYRRALCTCWQEKRELRGKHSSSA